MRKTGLVVGLLALSGPAGASDDAFYAMQNQIYQQESAIKRLRNQVEVLQWQINPPVPASPEEAKRSTLLRCKRYWATPANTRYSAWQLPDPQCEAMREAQ